MTAVNLLFYVCILKKMADNWKCSIIPNHSSYSVNFHPHQNIKSSLWRAASSFLAFLCCACLVGKLFWEAWLTSLYSTKVTGKKHSRNENNKTLFACKKIALMWDHICSLGRSGKRKPNTITIWTGITINIIVLTMRVNLKCGKTDEAVQGRMAYK